ncbi:hypothetical protein ACFV2Q_15765 [Streptomyces sp. NPDC059650]|uniref:hypothetical protein n=1 Tax=Streptomyces sp. NPDC059650 TaxID=3346896 RepID=UPI0036D1BAFC
MRIRTVVLEGVVVVVMSVASGTSLLPWAWGRRPSPVLVVKVVVIVVVALVTAVLGGLGQAPGTSLAVIVMVTTTALELARRITGDGPGSGERGGPAGPGSGSGVRAGW